MKKSLSIFSIVLAIVALLLINLIIQTPNVYAGGQKKYEYKTFWGKWKTKWTKYAYAGNQDKEGTHFANGAGGFYWSESGGPKVSVSFSYSAPFVPFSVGVSVGNKSNSSGEFVEITDDKEYVKKHMYKLQVKKRVKARPWVTKRRKKGTKKWKVYTRGKESVVIAKSLRAKAVGEYEK